MYGFTLNAHRLFSITFWREKQLKRRREVKRMCRCVVDKVWSTNSVFFDRCVRFVIVDRDPHWSKVKLGIRRDDGGGG